MEPPTLYAALAVAALTGSTHAQIIACGGSAQVGGLNSTLTPDFDQKRTGLLNDGSMHCVPTSFANLFAWHALNGRPQLFPGVGDPQSNAFYDQVTDHIAELGELMSTDGEGTGPDGARDGGRDWIEAHGNPPLNVVHYSKERATPQAMYNVLNYGGSAVICYGRYTQPSGPSGPWHRTGGGHAVTLSRVDRLCPGPTIYSWRVHYRNPSSNEDPTDLDAQSTFETTSYGAIARTMAYGDDAEVRTMWELITGQNDGVRRMWTRIYALMPEYGLYRPSSIGTGMRMEPALGQPGVTQSPSFNAGAVLDTAFSATPGVVFALRAPSGIVTVARLAAWDALANQSLAQVSLQSADALITVGRMGEVHVVDGATLRTFRFTGGDTPGFAEVGTPRALGTSPIEAIGFDDRRDEVILLQGNAGVARVTVDQNGAPFGSTLVLSTSSAPDFAASGKRRIAAGLSPTAEDYWIGPMVPSTIGGPDTIRRFAREPGGPARLLAAETISPPAPPLGSPGTWTASTPISDWTMADGSRMLLVRTSQVQELRRSLTWANFTGGEWFGRTARAPLAVSLSRSQTDRVAPPELEITPDDLPGIPDCAADIGRTGGLPGNDRALDNNDFVVFIDWFFGHDARADRGTTGGVPGHDGVFNNNDFVVFIDQFFQGC